MSRTDYQSDSYEYSPEECDHAAFHATGQTERDDDTLYVSGVCPGCGASGSAVYTISHYLVFEHDDADPVEVDA